MTYVIKEGGDARTVIGNPTLTSLDGEKKIRFLSIISDGWPDGFAAEFGIYDVDTTPPEGKRWSGQFDGSTTPPTPVFLDALGSTIDDVIAERETRLAAGFDYDFADARGVHHIATTADDMKKWQEVTDSANALINLGQGTQTITIATQTGPVDVTAMEWQAILVAAAQFRQPIYQASFALMAMDPIPDDFATHPIWDA